MGPRRLRSQIDDAVVWPDSSPNVSGGIRSFTAQLVAATSATGGLGSGVGLPAGLAELLVTHATRCSSGARAVLSTLAVAGRPLGEDLIDAASGLDADDIWGRLQKLTATRLLAYAAPRR
jgi:hypothetical protein